MNKTFDWLTTEEQTVLRGINADAENIVNALGVDMTENKLFPFTPIGTHAHQQGVNKPNLWGKHEIIKENSFGTVKIYCPFNSSFEKYETRKGVLARVRKNYFYDEWRKMVLACMKRNTRKLNWTIYPLSNGTHHLYLECDLPAVNSSKRGVSLYVPFEYFEKGDFNIVEKFHTDVAVDYYKGKGFRVEEKQLVEWQNMTAAALTCPEAMIMRRAVEGRKANL